MAIDWDDLPLSPWEQHVIAAMEDDFGRDDGIRGRAGRRPVERPGPLLFIAAVVAAFGTVLAFGVSTGATPLPIAGYILMLVGFTTVWEQLSPGRTERPSLRPSVRKNPHRRPR
jgi:hypothetical protein